MWEAVITIQKKKLKQTECQCLLIGMDVLGIEPQLTKRFYTF